ncbi:MAG: SRPBCC family protein [Bacteroidales bacterium]|nr:SRPBCC family protein [Bacteroidales bacterium]
MLQLNSKTGTINGSPEQVFEYVSDFRNMENILPKEIMSNIEVFDHHCRFDVLGIGKVGLQMVEKIPFSQIKIAASEGSPADFNLWIHILPHSANQTKVNFVLHAGLNVFLEAMAKKPLQQFIDMLADKMEQKVFNGPD